MSSCAGKGFFQNSLLRLNFPRITFDSVAMFTSRSSQLRSTEALRAHAGVYAARLTTMNPSVPATKRPEWFGIEDRGGG